MPYEVLKDPRGSTTNSEGIPYNESLTHQEGRRGMFQRFLLERQPEDHTNLTPIPPELKPQDKPKRQKGKTVINYQPGI